MRLPGGGGGQRGSEAGDGRRQATPKAGLGGGEWAELVKMKENIAETPGYTRALFPCKHLAKEKKKSKGGGRGETMVVFEAES